MLCMSSAGGVRTAQQMAIRLEILLYPMSQIAHIVKVIKRIEFTGSLCLMRDYDTPKPLESENHSSFATR